MKKPRKGLIIFIGDTIILYYFVENTRFHSVFGEDSVYKSLQYKGKIKFLELIYTNIFV